MKKYVISPLSSALVVPGLGQIINGQTKKGIVILIIVFILIVALTIDMALTIQSILTVTDISKLTTQNLLMQFRKADFSFLSYLIIAFGALWVYALLDALWVGIRLERRIEG
ncbi:MAG: hypothetical protein ABII06_21760 [Pseudomonadota bacterium]